MTVHSFIPIRKPSAYCGWLLLFYGMLTAQPSVRSITMEGNTFFSDRQLLEQTRMTLPVPAADISRFVASIEELYRGEGFYGFTVDSTVRSAVNDSTVFDVVLYFTENERTLVSQIGISGNRAFPAERLLSLMETAAGDPIRAAVLEADIRAMLELYSRSGFPFTAVSAESIAAAPDDPSELIVNLVVTEGPRVTIDEFRVEGNTATKTGIITREAKLSAGGMFDQQRLDAVRKRIERLQLFSSVSEPQLYIRPGAAGDTLSGGLLLTVTEGSTNNFDGILGYVPPSSPGTEGYITGNIFMAMRNLFGTGRKALLKWQRETALTQELELQYREPWLFGIPLSAGIGFQQRKQDSSYVRTKSELRADLAVTEALTVAVNVTGETVYPSAERQQFIVFQSEGFFYGADVLFDTRENPRNPTGGIRYGATVQQGTKRITGPEQFLSLTDVRNFTIQRFSLDADLYVSTLQRQVILLGLHGKYVSSTRLEVSDLYPLGGTTSIRGYRESQFFAAQFAYITAEYRFLTGRASSFFGFADAGYFSRPADVNRSTPGQERSLYGYGIGARIETGLGIMNISYALGEGDSYSNGKVHVGITNDF